MCRPNKWWWGVLPLAFLWLLAGYLRNDAIEADLSAKAAAQYPWATVALAGRDVTVAGVAPDEAARDAALKAIDGIVGVRQVAAGALGVIPEQKPFTFEAKREGDAVTLSGFVPSEDVRKTVAEAVKTAVPSAKITDNLAIARGAPAAFAAAAVYGVSQLGALNSSSFSLSDLAAKLAGIAPSLDGFAAVQAAAAPTELAVTKEITPPTITPYTFEVAKAADGVQLNGLVPSEAARGEVASAVAAAMPGLAVTDNLKLALGAPEGFGAAASFAISQLSKLTTGVTSLTDKAYAIAGDAPSLEVFNEVMAAKPPGDFAVAKSEVQAPAAATAPAVILPPYIFEASRDGSAVSLVGTVPVEADRTAIVDAVKAAVPGATITDGLQIRAGAPEGFAAAAAFGVSQLGKLSKGITSLTDKSYFIGGIAPTAEILQDVIAAVPPGGYAVEAPRVVAAAEPAPVAPPVAADVQIELPEAPAVVIPVSPYVWSAAKGADGVVLQGFVPDDATRADVVEAAGAANPGATITDRMAVGSGQPANFTAILGYGLGQLSRLSAGAVSVTNNAYSITGMAPTAEAFAAAVKATGSLPRGFTLAEANIIPPVASPYVFSVEKTAAGVTLAGNYPSEAARTNINQAAAAAFPGAAITDSMSIASGAPANLDAMIGFAMGQVSRLTTGVASISGTGFSISGAAPSVALFEATNAAVQKPPRGFTLASAAITGPAAEGAYVWTATKAADGAVTISGLAPSDQAKAFLADRAKATFPGAAITDTQTVKLGAPAGFAGMAVSAMNQLAALNFGQASLSESAFSISGEAPTQEVFDAATKAANSPAAGFATSSVAITLMVPTVRPYLVEVRKAASGAVTLLGYAPNADAKAALKAKADALAAGQAVDDRTSIALGLPETVTYEAATAAIFAELGKLGSGTARLADDKLSVYGNAPSIAVHDDVMAKLGGALPGGMVRQDVSISYPLTRPYLWSAERAPGSLTVKGYYQREADKAEVLNAAATRFPGEKIIDQMVPAAGAPACYTKAVDISMLQLSRLIFGTSELVDGKLTIKGEAQTDVAAAEIKAATEGIAADGCTGEAVITVRAPEAPVSNDECQALFKDVLGKGVILFDRDKADIKAESFGRLDNLAFVAKRCPDAQVEISAHADSDASTPYNQALSERRAKSVVDYLVNSGIGPGRLTAIGYGETRPLVPNTSRDNKAKNRRVEFNVQ